MFFTMSQIWQNAAQLLTWIASYARSEFVGSATRVKKMGWSLLTASIQWHNISAGRGLSTGVGSIRLSIPILLSLILTCLFRALNCRQLNCQFCFDFHLKRNTVEI